MTSLKSFYSTPSLYHAPINMYKQHVLNGMIWHIQQWIKGPCLLQFYDVCGKPWYKLLILSYKYWRKKAAMNSWSRFFSVLMCRVIKQKVFSVMNRFFHLVYLHSFVLFLCGSISLYNPWVVSNLWLFQVCWAFSVIFFFLKCAVCNTVYR